jgi:hypothetical protein
MRIEVEEATTAAPKVAFATATDIARWPQFITGIDSVEILTTGPVAVGTRFRETRLMHGRTATEEMTVKELEAPRLFVLSALSHGTHFRAEHRFEPDGDGTRMTVLFEGRPMTLLARLLTPLALLVIGSVRREIAADLAGLAREAERRSR